MKMKKKKKTKRSFKLIRITTDNKINNNIRMKRKKKMLKKLAIKSMKCHSVTLIIKTNSKSKSILKIKKTMIKNSKRKMRMKNKKMMKEMKRRMIKR
jgi:hypothetical protein